MRKKLSLKAAIIIPIIMSFLIILSLFIGLWRYDYNYLAQKQSNRAMENLIKHTEDNLHNFMNEGNQVAKILKSEIKYQKYYNDFTLYEIQEYFKTVKDTISDFEQISVLAYSDEKKQFVGIRDNDDRSQSLMLKDARTSEKLNIYSDYSMESTLLGSYEGYDPTVRPFYAPVKETTSSIWTNIYINYDEKMEATVTRALPVVVNEEFTGVLSVDIKLTGITRFLKNELKEKQGIIYILDQNNHIIAHSGETPIVEFNEKKERETGRLLLPSDSEDSLIKESFEYLEATDYTVPINKKMNGMSYYMMKSEWREWEGLDWKIFVALPETDLIGEIKGRHNLFIWFMIIFSIVISSALIYTLSRITKSILDSSEVANKIANGDLEVAFVSGNYHTSETSQLEGSLKKMVFQLKESFEKLEKNKEKYRILIENFDQMIYSIEPSGKVVTVNKAFRQAVNKTIDEIVGNNYREVFETIDHDGFWSDVFREVLSEKEIIKKQYSYFDRDRKERILKVVLVPLINENNRVYLVLGTSVDITELIEAHKKIEELNQNEKERLEKKVKERTKELKRATKELIEREKLASLGGLVSGVAHEINTPIGVSVTSVTYIEKIYQELIEAVQEGNLSEEEFISYLKSINESIDILKINLRHASKLVKDFKKISVNQTHKKQVKFNVLEYIDAVKTSLKHEFKNTNYQIEILCDEELMIESYPGAFTQVLTNLLMNSKIHGFKDRDNGVIKIKVESSDDSLMIEYSDDGKGISEGIIDKIFDPFFTTNLLDGGSGLGLSIVYNIINGKLKGSIRCESAKGEGTTFYIQIPLT